MLWIWGCNGGMWCISTFSCPIKHFFPEIVLFLDPTQLVPVFYYISASSHNGSYHLLTHCIPPDPSVVKYIQKLVTNKHLWLTSPIRLMSTPSWLPAWTHNSPLPFHTPRQYSIHTIEWVAKIYNSWIRTEQWWLLGPIHYHHNPHPFLIKPPTPNTH